MGHLIKRMMLVSAGILATALTGCAANRTDGGYAGEARTMTRLTPPAQSSPVTPPIAQGTGSAYVYRGGRDPITGKAYLSY
ncbi:MAG: hypothetical protein ABL901_18250 [Hyphomicrobiaceae bacterium]